jgi:hypothetical protein
VPVFAAHEGPLSRILTERGTEYCGSPDPHEYELALAVETIDHTRTQGKSPQTTGIGERVHKTMLTEFYRIPFRKKIDSPWAELQADLDRWLTEYTGGRVHQGRWGYGRPPLPTFLDTIPLAQEKLLAAEATGHSEHPDTGEGSHPVAAQVVTHYERAPLRRYGE